MKKQIYILNFLTIFLIFSCGQNSSKKKLNGKWYGIENNGYTRLFFYPDSLVFIELDKEIVDWSADKSKIKFDYPLIIWDSLGSPNIIKDKFIIHYKLSKNKDTLFSTFVNQFGENNLNLIRAKNYIEYLNKRYEIKFSLPEDNSVENLENPNNEYYDRYGLKVFMGYLDNKIVGKTELSENLNYIESDIKSFKDSIKPNGRTELDGYDKFYDHRFHLRVFADKKIPDSTITKYLQATIKRDYERLGRSKRDTLPIRIYRIYQSKEQENLSVLKGKEIKTIANMIKYSAETL